MRIESSQRPTGRARALPRPCCWRWPGRLRQRADYRAPATPSAAAGPFVSQSERTNAGAELPSDWWRLYDDATLNGLLQEALAANPDLRAALANLDKARAVSRPGSGCCRPPAVGRHALWPQQRGWRRRRPGAPAVELQRRAGSGL